ncbi:MAG: diguanylate cyclase [Pirellulales bacterium]|nr:diguanylate cyclase [Pirellulales bacterium]
MTRNVHPDNQNVLLVDDDPSMRRLLSRWLQEAGYHVRQASDGQEALDEIDLDCPDFLVTDWEMPGMNGLELCRRVRALDLSKYVYILFLTVKSTSAEVIEGLDIGADDYLSKPIIQGELIARMRAGARIIELERWLGVMARTDPLTGLITQRAFFDAFQKEWERTSRSRSSLSCVMLDIDFFKRVNDLHGHPMGDAVLKVIGNVLEDNCRTNDVLCRYGGEEFCAMLPETDEMAAAAWAERVRKLLAETTVSLSGKTLQVTASFGVSQRIEDTQSVEELVDRADQALLCAKQSGRDRVVRFTSLSDTNAVDLAEADQHGIFKGAEARHVMSPMVACLQQDETIGQAAEFFLRSRINSTPVVDGEGILVGILSEKDLMAALVTPECWGRPVREVMKPNVICYEESTPVQTIYEFLCRVSIRRVIIVEEGRPTGTISRGTLLRWFRNLVVSKGLLDSSSTNQSCLEKDPCRSKERLAETADALAQLAAGLKKCLQDDCDDLMPHIVGSATRMQDLVNDLLAFSRFANPGPVTGAEALRAMMLSTGHAD